MLSGWSADPAVRAVLDGLSRLHAVRYTAVEGQPTGPGDRLSPAGEKAAGPVRVGESIVGWVLVDPDGVPPARLEAMAGEAAALVSVQVGTLGELESLSGEIADTYEELNLLYNLSESLGPLRDETAICRVVLEQAQRVIGGSAAASFS